MGMVLSASVLPDEYSERYVLFSPSNSTISSYTEHNTIE